MFQLLLPLLVALLVSLAFAAYVFIRAPAPYHLRLAMIVAAFAAAAGCVPLLENILGWAYPRALPDRFVLLGSRVLIDGGEKIGIEVWTGGPHSRLLLVPYSRKLEKALEEAKRKGQGGGSTSMRRGRQCPPGSVCPQTELEDDDFVSNITLPYEFNPKDAP